MKYEISRLQQLPDQNSLSLPGLLKRAVGDDDEKGLVLLQRLLNEVAENDAAP